MVKVVEQMLQIWKYKFIKENSTGIFTKDDAVAKNETGANINLEEKNSVGIFGLASAAGKKNRFNK